MQIKSLYLSFSRQVSDCYFVQEYSGSIKNGCEVLSLI